MRTAKSSTLSPSLKARPSNSLLKVCGLALRTRSPRFAVLMSSQAALALSLFAIITTMSAGTNLQMASMAIMSSCSETSSWFTASHRPRGRNITFIIADHSA